MAYRRATGALLAHRRALSSFLSPTTTSNEFRKRMSTIILFDEADVAVAAQSRQHSCESSRQHLRCFSSHSSRNLSAASSLGSSIRGGSNSDNSRNSSSEVLGEKLNTRISSEDEHEEADLRIWKDEGDDDFGKTTAEPLGEAAAMVDRGSTDSLGVGGEVASGSIWSILRAPADGVVVLVDALHTLTGTPWCSEKDPSGYYSLIRLALENAVPPIRPPKDSKTSLAEQYRIFTKRRLELGVPSPFWATAGLLQAPLFLYWIIALRGMAMNHHPGFESGGALWFVDLTVPVHGALGALFPSIVALTHFINVQVSFRAIKPRNDLTGFVMKIYQWWLEAVTIPLFILGFYLPQVWSRAKLDPQLGP